MADTALSPSAKKAGGNGAHIRTGIGGWTFDPWRGTFYPADLPKTKELDYAVNHLGTIEINGTFYRTQSPATFAKWRDAAPEGFVHAVKALRYTVAKKRLADAGESIGKFLASGISELGDKLGPILWQFSQTRQFDPDDIAAFLSMLPGQLDGVDARHAIEVRHESFACSEFVDLARKHKVAIVIADHEDYPQIADVTADFIYARLMSSKADLSTGYSEADLTGWAKIAQSWSHGEQPPGLNYNTHEHAKAEAREVYAYFISSAKEHNPAAAIALAEKIASLD